MTDLETPGAGPESSTSPGGATTRLRHPRDEDEKRALIRRLNELTRLGLVEHDCSEFSKTRWVKVRYKLPILNELPHLNVLPSGAS